MANSEHFKCTQCRLCIGTECIFYHPPPTHCTDPVHEEAWSIYTEKRSAALRAAHRPVIPPDPDIKHREVMERHMETQITLLREILNELFQLRLTGRGLSHE